MRAITISQSANATLLVHQPMICTLFFPSMANIYKQCFLHSATMPHTCPSTNVVLFVLSFYFPDVPDDRTQAKKVVNALHAPHSETFQVGNAYSAAQGAALASRPAVVLQAPSGASPFIYPGVAAADAASSQSFSGTSYPVVSSNPYSTIYGAFQNYGPMQRWAEEDSAEHALNLNRWRMRILEAKLEQAKLRRALMNQQKIGDKEAEELPSLPKAGSSTKGKGGAAWGKGGVEKDVGRLKRMLASVAEETSSALESLTSQVGS
jgi:hypothetical protein